LPFLIELAQEQVGLLHAFLQMAHLGLGVDGLVLGGLPARLQCLRLFFEPLHLVALESPFLAEVLTPVAMLLHAGAEIGGLVGQDLDLLLLPLQVPLLLFKLVAQARKPSLGLDQLAVQHGQAVFQIGKLALA